MPDMDADKLFVGCLLEPSSRLWCKLEAGAEPQSDPLCGHYACYLSASL